MTQTSGSVFFFNLSLMVNLQSDTHIDNFIDKVRQFCDGFLIEVDRINSFQYLSLFMYKAHQNYTFEEEKKSPYKSNGRSCSEKALSHLSSSRWWPLRELARCRRHDLLYLFWSLQLRFFKTIEFFYFRTLRWGY